MIRYFKSENRKITEIDQIEKDCWVNIQPPINPDTLKKFSDDQNIPFDYLLDSLDIDERSRFEVEDDITLIVLKAPILNETSSNNEPLYITIPIGLVITPNNIFTISAYESPIIEDFIENRMKNIDPSNKKDFILKTFERSVFYFLQYLNEMNRKRSLFEQRMIKSMNNHKLVQLMNLEKSLVYFATSLRTNEVLLMKLRRTNTLELNEDQDDFLEDIIVDNSQALEMANIYTNILSSTMDTFASIISNNLNTVMRRLTTVTLILMVPTLIASLYGMNVPLPMANNKLAFPMIIMVSLVFVGLSSLYFKKQKWF
jgi:magnesium transporter